MPATLDLYINTSSPARRALCQDFDSLSAPSTPEFVIRDTVRLRLHFMTVASGSRTGTSLDLGGSVTINFGGKPAANFATATSYLFYTSSFTRDATNVDDVVYEADLDLNTTEFVTAIGSSESVGIKIEVEVDDGTALQTVAQADATGINDVIDGTSSSPTGSTPAYPAAPAADSLLGGNAAGTAWTNRNPAAVRVLLGLDATSSPKAEIHVENVTATDIVSLNELACPQITIGNTSVLAGGAGAVVTFPPATGTLAAFTTVPATATSTGSAGMMAYDSSYLYICTATNTWKRVAIATW